MENINYIALAQAAKKDKKYDEEEKYLLSALELKQKNPKILNALIRNARKRKDIKKEECWLEKLYEIKPSGEILFALIRIAKMNNDEEKVEELNRRKDIFENKIKEPIDDETWSIIELVRDLIYSDLDYSVKEEKIKELLINQTDEIIFYLYSELYKHDLNREYTIRLVKKYIKQVKEQTLETSSLKVVNQILNIVSMRKNRKYVWDDFWRTYGRKPNSLANCFLKK